MKTMTKRAIKWMIPVVMGTAAVGAVDAPALAGSAVLATGQDGHRVDGDKVDAYARATVFADGSWNAFAHTTPTGHFLGGCNRVTLVFFGDGGAQLYATDAGIFCTGTRDGVGGPPDREDNVGGGSGSIPADAISNTRSFAVIVSGGHKDTAIDWPQVFDIASKIATAAAAIFGG
jgi:hypothetical protein